MDVSNRRIVILGKTGTGKSSLANTIFEEKLFKTAHTPNSETRECQAKTRSVNGRSINLIDTPGFFDTDRSEEELKPEIVRCIIECAPGPHAFLIVLKVEKFTEQEQEVINQIHQYFSEEVFKYATVLFTHGDQLCEGQTIEDFVSQNKSMSDLVKKCGGRCHVVDNKYWNNNQQDEYRSNQFQVKELLKTIEKTLLANKGSCCSNEMLQEVEEEIQEEEEHIRLLSGNMSERDIREQAKVSVSKKLLIKLAGTATGVLLGAFFGVVVMVGVVVPVLKQLSKPSKFRQSEVHAVVAFGAGVAGTAVGGAAIGAAEIPLIVLTAASAAAGAVIGGVKGYDAAEGAETPREAAKRAAKAVKNKALSILGKPNDALNKTSQAKFKHS